MSVYEYSINILKEEIKTLEGSIEMVKNKKTTYYTEDDVERWETEIGDMRRAIKLLKGE